MNLLNAPVNDDAGHRRDIDDRPLPARQHHLRFSLARQKNAGEIDIQHLLPLRKGHLFGGSGIRDTGTIHS